MTTSFDPKNLSQQDLHNYLINGVAPRPICLASTIDAKGGINLSPFSFFNVFSSNPPVMIFSPARRGRDNTTKHTLQNIQDTMEVVIHAVDYAMVEQMSLSSNEYPKGTNEFVKAGFTQLESTKVMPPRVAEAPIAFECAVDQVIALGDQGGAGNLVLARVLLIHIQDHLLDANSEIESINMDLVARMGGDWYCRAKGEALFQVAKPNAKLGIGVDALPRSVQMSTILTGNDLGKLGSLPDLPNTADLKIISKESEWMAIGQEYAKNSIEYNNAIHRLAKSWISTGRNREALAALIIDQSSGK